MPETAHKFKGNGRFHDETIHKFFSLASVHFLFAAIADMMDGLSIKCLLVGQPLEGGPGLVDASPSPTLRGLHGNVVVQMFLPPIQVAR